MENVTVSPEQVQAQEAAEEKASEELSEKKQQAKGGGSRRLADIVGKSATPSRFEAPEEEAPEEEQETDGDPDASEDDKDNEQVDDGGADEQEKSGDAADGDDPETEDSDTTAAGAVSEQLKQAYPDKDFDDPEAVSSTIDQLVADSNNLAAEREANEKVYDLFESSPEMVQIARAMDSGKGFLEALAASVDVPEAIEEMKEEDPQQYKDILKAQAKREADLERKAAEREEMEQAFADNQADSQDNLDAFKEKKDMDDTQRDEFVDAIGEHFDNIVYGKVTPEFLDVMYRGMEYDTAVAQAKEEGRIEGKNEKINAEKRKKAGDGMPTARNGKPKKPKAEASDGKRAIAGIVSGSRSTFN